jgi:hypothetical protein
MSVRSAVGALLKFLALAVLYIVLFNVTSGLVPTGLAWTPPPDALPWVFGGMALVALVNTAVISLVITRSGWGGWRLYAATALAWYGVMVLLSQIETAWFAPALGIPYSVPVAILVNNLPLVLLFTAAAVWAWGKTRPPAEAFDARERLPQSAGEWAWKLALVAPIYLGLYFGFGFVVAWQNPALAAMYGGGADPTVFNNAYLIPLQIARSALWVLCAVPIIRMTRGPLWQVALLVGLFYALPMNIAHAIPNPIMPDATVRLSHFIETATSNFIFGLIVTWLLQWRPSRRAVREGLAAG